jgi:release factor glutamine methyltransferase
VADAVTVAAAERIPVRQAIADATASLAAAGCDTPRLDAELLLGSVLGVDRSRLVIRGAEVLDASVLERFGSLLARRVAREPVAYILGSRAFRRISLIVDRRVLIPRPETELLVEVGLTLAHGARVVDVGSGSGAVALALKDERPGLRVMGVDVSEDAVDIARANAAALGLDVRFEVRDLLGGQCASVRPADRVDAVLANLPYVSRDTAALPPESVRYEPAEALFAGPDGLDLIRRLVASVDPRVSIVALEVGFDQASAVDGLLSAAGFGSVERLRDLAGHERVIVGRRL